MNNKTHESILFVLFCGVLLWAAYTVLTPVPLIDHRQMYVEPRDYPPKIPHCDKELWDRIREGCD
jgi:hypothetical protein